MDPKEEGCRRIQEVWGKMTPEERAIKISEEQMKHYKSLRKPKELEEIPVDILRCLYFDAMTGKL